MSFQEFLSEDPPTPLVRVTCAILLTFVSIFGSISNSLVFFGLLPRIKKEDGFLKICCAKSFGNGIVCIGYLIWPIPVTFLNEYFLPHMFNAFMGQLVGWFGWSISPLSQVLLTTNRIFAVFAPHLYHRSYRIAPSNLGIYVCLFLSFLLFIAFFPEDCHYLYNLEEVGWLPEKSLCTSIRRAIFIVSMIIIVIITSGCGITLFLRLVADTKSTVASSQQSANRRGKHRQILFQTLMQNTLILVDTLNTTVTYDLYPVLFFQFLTLSFSMVFLRALEGLIMLLMNERIAKKVKILLGFKQETLQSIRGAQSMIFNVSSKN